MTEYRKQTAFLRRILHFDGTDESRRLVEGIAHVQRDECCVERAAWLMALLTMLAVAGLACSAVLLGNLPYNQIRILINVLCAVGLASLSCLAAFLGLLMTYRKRMNQLREDCRRLVIKRLESNHGRPHITPLPSRGLEAGDREVAQSGLRITGSSDGLQPTREGPARSLDETSSGGNSHP